MYMRGHCSAPLGGAPLRLLQRSPNHTNEGLQMDTPTKLRKIHALFGLTRLPDGTVTPLLNLSLKGLTENVQVYSSPPIDMMTYQAGIAAYEAALPAALDGGKTAIAQKNKLREEATRMYVLLAHYVEAHCNNDMATFLLSGFQPAPTTKAQPQPLAMPTIAYVVQGPNSGELKVKIGSVEKALHYDLRYGSVPSAGETPAAWIQQLIASTKPMIITELKPGTIYTFQVRAFGRLGYTDWC